MDKHVYARSGFASLDDLKDPAAHELFLLLEREQAGFLSQEAAFRSPDYKWPRAPLHTWSRCWEYPYVYRAVRDDLLSAVKPAEPVVADIGSGVTFFPFALARLGCRMVCTDVDPICVQDFARLGPVVSGAPGKVEFRPCTPERLPFADAECDGIVCLSVIEHIKDPAPTLDEMVRILKPGGLLCLTIDLDLCGGHEIGPEGYERLHGLLRRRFVLAEPEHGVHPRRLLTTNCGPYPIPDPPGPAGLRLLARDLLKNYLGTDMQPAVKYQLAVEGTLWRKPATTGGVHP
jgi:SAM-dependent methyltransferase